MIAINFPIKTPEPWESFKKKSLRNDWNIFMSHMQHKNIPRDNRCLAGLAGLRQAASVRTDDFSDATLVVLGHGTELNENSAAPVFQHAAELRRRRVFASVREAFWKQDPQVKKVLAEIDSPRAFIVPLFVSEGYFASNIIPKDLGFPSVPSTTISRRSTICYCRPVGSHDSMTRVILARAQDVLKRFPFPRPAKNADTTLVIAGHGTEKNADSRKAIDRQVELIRAQNIFAAVQAVFLDEDPRIPEVYALAQTKNIVMVPFFISDGLHTQEDIPVLLGEAKRIVGQRLAAGQPTWRNPTEKNGKLVWYSPAIGSAPELAEVILEQVRDAATAGS